MKSWLKRAIFILPLLLIIGIVPAWGGLFVQCPGDENGDGVSDDPNVVCIHVSAGDGFVKMADGYDQYMFSYGLIDPRAPLAGVVSDYALKARTPAPTLELKEGQELYLTLTNVTLVMRPDLFDPHSIHWHGFPNAGPIFDGLPEVSPTVNMGASFTYYYKASIPGSYFYHCHVEAVEHMQMGMIGNAWIKPAQDGQPFEYQGKSYTKFVYNDGDGATGYDVAYPIQLTAFDSVFHDASESIQPLPFASMYDNYPMINGRGYPDTINTNVILNKEGFAAQPDNSLITAKRGDRILLRVSNVSTTHLYSIATTMGIPMKIVGRGGAILRGHTGLDTSMEVSVLNVGGGHAFDVMLDTTNVPAGTYVLYTTDLANLSNGDQERGGIMTEIVITN
jgi:FtsP/CotA-like multicopper oxidase with cupredoxin domain